MPDFCLYGHWRGLAPEQRTRFAKLAKTSIGYIENHLIHRRKTPLKPLIRRLTRACRLTGASDKLTEADLVMWFYKKPAPKRRAAAPAAEAAAS
jgi:hypothetical protein